jgi:hypothetical protein
MYIHTLQCMQHTPVEPHTTSRVASKLPPSIPTLPYVACSIIVCSAMLLIFPSMSFDIPGMPRIESTTVWANLAIMILGQAVLTDALVVLLSRTEFISGIKVDLPSAWKERSRRSYLAMYGMLALATANGAVGCVFGMCYTHTPETGPHKMADYTLSLCPHLEVNGVWPDGIDAIREKYGLYPNVSSVVW